MTDRDTKIFPYRKLVTIYNIIIQPIRVDSKPKYHHHKYLFFDATFDLS